MPGAGPAAPGPGCGKFTHQAALRAIAENEEFEVRQAAPQLIGRGKEEVEAFFPVETAEKYRQSGSLQAQLLQHRLTLFIGDTFPPFLQAADINRIIEA